MTLKDLGKALQEAGTAHEKLQTMKAIANYYSNVKPVLEEEAIDQPVPERCRIHFNWRDLCWDDLSWGWNTCYAERGQTPREAVIRMLYTTGTNRNLQWGKDRKDVEYKNVRVIDYIEYDQLCRITYMD